MTFNLDLWTKNKRLTNTHYLKTQNGVFLDKHARCCQIDYGKIWKCEQKTYCSVLKRTMINYFVTILLHF